MNVDRRRFILVHEIARARAVEAVREAPDGWTVLVREPQKSRDQEEKYHAMIGDIARHYEFCGRHWDAEDMKRLLIDQFKRDTVSDPDFVDEWKAMGSVEMAPSLDGMGVVALGTQSRRFPKKLASGFVEWLYAFGSEHDVQWTEPKQNAVA
jgi:hypothetical protein